MEMDKACTVPGTITHDSDFKKSAVIFNAVRTPNSSADSPLAVMREAMTQAIISKNVSSRVQSLKYQAFTALLRLRKISGGSCIGLSRLTLLCKTIILLA